MELPHASTARILLSGCNTSTFWGGSQKPFYGHAEAKQCVPHHAQLAQTLVAEPTRFLQQLPSPPPKLFFAVKWRHLVANLLENRYKFLRDSAVYSKPRKLFQPVAAYEPMRPLRRPTNAPPPKLFFASRWRRLIGSFVRYTHQLSIAATMLPQPQTTSVVEPIRLLPAPAPPPKHFFATRWRGLIARLTEHRRTQRRPALSALAQVEPQSRSFQ